MIVGWAKAYHRTTCTYNYQALRDGLPVTFDKIMPISFVRRALDHCFRFMDGYRKGLTGPVLEYAVKKYKSRRRLSSSLLLENVEKEYLIKQETMMRFNLLSNLISIRNAIYNIFSIQRHIILFS